MKKDFEVHDLVPHSGKMSLLGAITDYGDEWLQAEVSVTAQSMFADERGIPAWIGLEYMAQAIAAYAGLQERKKGGVPRIGFLLGSRNYSSSSDYFIHGQTLSVRVQLDFVADNGLNVFRCELKCGDVLASAVVNVFQPDDVEKFLQEANS